MDPRLRGDDGAAAIITVQRNYNTGTARWLQHSAVMIVQRNHDMVLRK
jgi:hypothetical protein